MIQLTARTLRVFDAAEADQGVAADKTHFYAVGNTIIAKYAHRVRDTRRPLGRAA